MEFNEICMAYSLSAKYRLDVEQIEFKQIKDKLFEDRTELDHAIYFLTHGLTGKYQNDHHWFNVLNPTAVFQFWIVFNIQQPITPIFKWFFTNKKDDSNLNTFMTIAKLLKEGLAKNIFTKEQDFIFFYDPMILGNHDLNKMIHSIDIDCLQPLTENCSPLLKQHLYSLTDSTVPDFFGIIHACQYPVNQLLIDEFISQEKRKFVKNIHIRFLQQLEVIYQYSIQDKPVFGYSTALWQKPIGVISILMKNAPLYTKGDAYKFVFCLKEFHTRYHRELESSDLDFVLRLKSFIDDNPQDKDLNKEYYELIKIIKPNIFNFYSVNKDYYLLKNDLDSFETALTLNPNKTACFNYIVNQYNDVNIPLYFDLNLTQ